MAQVEQGSGRGTAELQNRGPSPCLLFSLPKVLPNRTDTLLKMGKNDLKKGLILGLGMISHSTETISQTCCPTIANEVKPCTTKTFNTTDALGRCWTNSVTTCTCPTRGGGTTGCQNSQWNRCDEGDDDGGDDGSPDGREGDDDN